ncbi:hypothetical protein Godav_005783 [Gossypium davidsonii]|uniref:Uncharacterized protein n=1 Tax=Gossypium davidsonii TaxID=34287 RepID=A0A7J8S340_GOSDV|nr:hypothetical protein [Gossypium davidsonii]
MLKAGRRIDTREVQYRNIKNKIQEFQNCFWCRDTPLKQNCVIIGVRYSFPTFASALANLIPAFTFVLVVIFKFVSAVMPFVFIV